MADRKWPNWDTEDSPGMVFGDLEFVIFTPPFCILYSAFDRLVGVALADRSWFQVQS